MKRLLHIHVTAEDIAAGTQGDPGSCPIALACSRAGLKRPSVDSGTIDFDGGWVSTPENAATFVEMFDNDEGPAPFAFEIDVPEEAVRA